MKTQGALAHEITLDLLLPEVMEIGRLKETLSQFEIPSGGIRR